MIDRNRLAPGIRFTTICSSSTGQWLDRRFTLSLLTQYSPIKIIEKGTVNYPACSPHESPSDTHVFVPPLSLVANNFETVTLRFFL